MTSRRFLFRAIAFLILPAIVPAGQASEAGWHTISLSQEAWFYDSPGEPGEFNIAWIEHTPDGIEAVLHKGTGFIGYISDVVECGTRPVYIEADVEVSSPNVALALIGMNSDAADYASVFGTFNVSMPITARGFEETGTLSTMLTPEGGHLGIALQAALPDSEAFPDWVFVKITEVRYSVLSELTDTELAYVIDPERRPAPTATPTPSSTPAGPTYTPTDTPTPSETGTPTATGTPTQDATLPPELTVDIPGLAALAEPLTLRAIQSGSFTIGSATDEAGRNDSEGPQHPVTISEPYYIGQHEVTNAQFAAFLSAEGNVAVGGIRRGNVSSPAFRIDVTGSLWESEAGFEDHPVVDVTWHGAKDFCVWLNERAGGAAYRLPTEAEWEYACRAGTATRYYWGDDPLGEAIGGQAWHSANAAGVPHPVGERAPNGWGLYDMSGNAWEWCQDVHSDYGPDPQIDPQGPPSGDFRVIRGGSFSSNAVGCRSAVRARNAAEDSWGGLGFRVAASSDASAPSPTPMPTSIPDSTPTPTPTPSDTPAG